MKHYKKPRTEDIVYDEERLRATIERRRQARAERDNREGRYRRQEEVEEVTNG